MARCVTAVAVGVAAVAMVGAGVLVHDAVLVGVDDGPRRADVEVIGGPGADAGVTDGEGAHDGAVAGEEVRGRPPIDVVPTVRAAPGSGPSVP